MPLYYLRVGCRAVRLACTLSVCALDYWVTVKLPGKTGSVSDRASWMQRQGRRLARAVGITATYEGEPPSEGILVSNHLSYTDILVLGARNPLVFIAKSEVASWPIFGKLSQFGGTLFVRREVRSDVARLGVEMPKILEAGVVLAFFPEGTSTGGTSVLPFHASLFAPACANGWTITPAFVRYELDSGDGSVEDEVAYWRDMEFGPHLLNLLGKRRVRAVITYGKPERAGKDRKALAVELREKVTRLGGL